MLIFLLFELLLLCCNNLVGYDQYVYNGAVTYSFSGGRFGDNLLSYLHAKWLSYKYDIPLIYKPFPHSEKLTVDISELRYDEQEIKKFSRISMLSYGPKLCIERDAGVLYVVPFFVEAIGEPENCYSLFRVDWYDKKFLEIIRQMIAPCINIPRVKIPTGYLGVVVHVRKGCGLDRLLADEPERIPKRGVGYSDILLPLKTLPDQYYIEQIRRLYFLYNKQPLYIYIVCDRDTQKVVNYYKQQLSDLLLIVEGDKWGKSDPENPVFDFFLMLQFDCIIRSESNLSLVASKIGNFLTVVSPVGFHRVNDYTPIDKLWVSFTMQTPMTDSRI